MDIKSECNSSRKTKELGRICNDIEHTNSVSATRSSKFRWKMLWMKLKKEKKRLFESTSSPLQQVPYDPFTYSQNFEQGTVFDEPDYLSRSFSVRFADPCKFNNYQKKWVV